MQSHFRGHVPDTICAGRWDKLKTEHACGRSEYHTGQCQCWCGERTKIA